MTKDKKDTNPNNEKEFDFTAHVRKAERKNNQKRSSFSSNSRNTTFKRRSDEQFSNSRNFKSRNSGQDQDYRNRNLRHDVVRKRPSTSTRSNFEEVGIFIDGVGLDRASRRLGKKVDWAKLIKSLAKSSKTVVARYYNLLPIADDSRQVAFLEAISKSGLQPIIKRLPPKTSEMQISTNLEMASDLIFFALGQKLPEVAARNVRSNQVTFLDLTESRTEHFSTRPEDNLYSNNSAITNSAEETKLADNKKPEESDVLFTRKDLANRGVIIVCPSKELEYPVSLLNELGVHTTAVDFGTFSARKTLTLCKDWTELNEDSPIWKE